MTVLIAGGYGVVGAQIARLLRKRNPGLRLLIGGRSQSKAQALALKLGDAAGVRFDVNDENCLSRLPETPQLLVIATNDLNDVALKAAMRANVALIDITRWTSRVRDLEAIVQASPSSAPVVQGSSWMACVPGALALQATASLQRVEAINMDILYALKDISGENSVEYMDRLSAPFAVVRDGQPGLAIPYTEGRKTRFSNGYETKVYRFDCPDQTVLPQLCAARSVAARIAFDDKTTTAVFWFIIRSGIWGLLSGPRFMKLRRSLLHNPGTGAPHHVRVDIEGQSNGALVHRTLHLTDAAGQSHMTAVGAALQTEWVLGLNGFVAPGPGLHYGERMGPAAVVLAAFKQEGILVTEDC
ncbi:hypothetical protein VT06_16300 [Arsukibacterium sp. MJ3]|uniref:hypothetical protein n=1 Tax=Arsukibacterium sp. MJ3 TaxID=1632859 RepID=UPI000626F557|nr:hypothetical protein [Arsukibacterium sp. MJ3]KKO47572.1 hypothetical protein VT06_16300 [Arsukibacterium sp. MJ3]